MDVVIATSLDDIYILACQNKDFFNASSLLCSFKHQERIPVNNHTTIVDVIAISISVNKRIDVRVNQIGRSQRVHTMHDEEAGRRRPHVESERASALLRF